MADTQYITENKLGKKADLIDEITQQQDKAYLAGVIFVLSLCGLWTAQGPIIAVVFCSLALILTTPIWGDKSSKGLLAKMEAFCDLPIEPIDKSISDRYRSGLAGEEHVLQLLEALPDTYSLFNQVDIPNKNSSTGFNEADFIVVGPSAIFTIEVKNNKGDIYGHDKQREWIVNKMGNNSIQYQTTMRNPVSQIRKATWLLSQYFKSHRQTAHIQSLVVFSHKDADIGGVQSSTTPVLSSNQLIQYIESYQGRSKHSELCELKKILADLKRTSLGESEPASHKILGSMTA